MTQFKAWCASTPHQAGTRTVEVLAANPGATGTGISLLATSLSDHYASRQRLADLLGHLGKPAAAEYIRGKYPTTAKIRSGDLGEILGFNWVEENTSFSVSVKRLRWKDHRDQAMRGDDLLAFEAPASGPVQFLKGEVKSAASLSNVTVKNARKALASHAQRPSPHAISYVIDRLKEQSEKDLVNQLDAATLKASIKIAQVTHLMFVFTGSNPAGMLTSDLKLYPGKVKQLSVGLHIPTHQDFIQKVYEGAIAHGV